MTKSELIDAVAKRTRIPKSRAERVVNCIFETMTSSLERGEGIEIRGFGTFTIRVYKPYSGRNPRTGSPVSVSEKRLPYFKVGKELKELVNRGPAPLQGGADPYRDSGVMNEGDKDGG
jgi:integration host factor subunit beta